MSKLKVVTKDTVIEGPRKTLEVYYEAGGEYLMDTYEQDYTYQEDETGRLVVNFSIGRVKRVITYGFGEYKKHIEIFEN